MSTWDPYDEPEFEGIYELPVRDRPVMSPPPRMLPSRKLIDQIRVACDLDDATAERVANWAADWGAGEQIKASVQVYTAALTAMQKTLADMLRIGLSAEALRAAKERPSREQAEALQRVIDGLLGGLDLSAEQRAKVPAALTEAVRREGLL